MVADAGAEAARDEEDKEKTMKIAVASGKGGTGKTTLAVSLALSAPEESVIFLDCDVEAPNSHLFLKPLVESDFQVYLKVPEIDEDKCTFCGACRDICRFNAITVFGKTIMTFPEMCHSCGGCFRVCEAGAIKEKSRLVGRVEKGNAGHNNRIKFVSGVLRIGEAMAVPLINAVKKEAANYSSALTILDAPPGTSCPVVSTINDVDFCILVTEPTPFGLHDLKIAVEVSKKLGVPFGVVINKAGLGDDAVERWCAEQNIPVLLMISFSREIAGGYARGIPLSEISPDIGKAIKSLLVDIKSGIYGGVE